MPGPQPIYRVDELNPAYQLRYSWAAWSSRGESLPTALSAEFLESINSLWEGDGLRLLESRIGSDRLQITFSAKPAVSPVLLATRAKGRLDHALRKSGTPVSFSRKVAVRSLGDARRDAVEAYIERQVVKEPFADERFRGRVHEVTVVNPDVDLSVPSESRSGRYWYNLHVVLVTLDRSRLTDNGSLATVRDTALRVAEKKRYCISRLSVMPDHLHLALRGHIEHSPQDIALAFLNNLAYAMGQKPIWQHGYYAGTFSEYDMGAVRASAQEARLET